MGTFNGYHGSSPVANSVCLHDLVPHHFPGVLDRPCGLAHGPRGAASRNRSPGLSRDLRILAENIWRGIWIGRRIRSRDGVSVRHQLERALQDVRADPGPASIVRNLRCLHAGGDVFRRAHLRSQPRAAMVLSVFDRHGGAGNHVFGVLDHDEQQLDAGAGRLCCRKWCFRSRRLDKECCWLLT